ncbi:DUF1684 domain-containing protein [Microbacterium sp. SORGH_AS_0888]|uniref:DUF1684 domain-containing protein n=1 Tax=Microbacterium sp. SORGH_AS_0888 TaxID=3041791 RepID=UPI0027851E0F|nr:DUF1684 domain-containing protein [Microbacterium sp. SORGH_AS_0888]MDQ1130545.1 uncharacterized protein (DUF1684 family) [Microbacterium sp. SORGH_AS_0888]
MSTPVIDDTAFLADWRRWREERDRAVAAPDGILPVVSIDYLTAEPVVIDRLPGRWSSQPEGVVVDLAEGERLDVAEADGSGRVVLDRPAPGGSRRIAQEGLTIELVRGGDWDIVRVRDAAAPAVAAFRGTPAYEPDPAWRVVGRWVPGESALTVDTVSDRVSRESVSPGAVEFTLRGRTFRLVALPAHGVPGHVVLLFRDATSGITTYAAQRELLVQLPASGDEVVVDFTRAYNKPCAYSDFALCPLPPAGNVLDIAVEAGERTPYERSR